MNALKPWHVIVLLVVVLLLFGAKRLPDLAKSVGEDKITAEIDAIFAPAAA